MESRIEKITNRLKQLKSEIVMGNYYDGWTLHGMKEEYARLEAELKVLTND